MKFISANSQETAVALKLQFRFNLEDSLVSELPTDEQRTTHMAAGGPNFATLQNADEVKRLADRHLTCVLGYITTLLIASDFRLTPQCRRDLPLQGYYAAYVDSCQGTCLYNLQRR